MTEIQEVVMDALRHVLYKQDIPVHMTIQQAEYLHVDWILLYK